MRDDEERLRRFEIVSARLGRLGDEELRALLPGATVSGIGGHTGTLTVDGVEVFVKHVPLTALELDNRGCTGNLFGLPTHYQYGIGSAGFGAWRELAVHTMTTGWVLDGRFGGFPLMYHARVLPRSPAPADPAEVERWVDHWHGSPEVRARLEAIGSSPAVVTLFLEHIPHTVDAWLTSRGAYAWVDRQLAAGVSFLESEGLVHFDAHFHNLLTDGHRLYFADFGLALHESFTMTAGERAFFERHRGYDRAYTSTHLTQWLITKLLDVPWSDFRRLLAEPDLPLPGEAARIVARHRPVAAPMADFWTRLEHSRHDVAYPAAELAAISPR